MTSVPSPERRGVDWKQVGLFLASTFGLTWALNLVLWLTVGYGENPATGVSLQLQMLLPASCAIVLGMFVFRGNALYIGQRAAGRLPARAKQPGRSPSHHAGL